MSNELNKKSDEFYNKTKIIDFKFLRWGFRIMIYPLRLKL